MAAQNAAGRGRSAAQMRTAGDARRGRGRHHPESVVEAVERGARGGVAAERFADQPRERRGHRGGQEGRGIIENRAEQRDGVFAFPQLAAGQHLVKQEAERVDVGGSGLRLAEHLLGRHVDGGAEDHAGLGRLRGRLECSGNSEVEEAHGAEIGLSRPAGNQDVGRLEVAMDNAVGVRLAEGAGDPGAGFDGLRQGQRAGLQDHVETRAFDPFRRGIRAAPGHAGVEQGDYIRVIEGLRHAGFGADGFEHLLAGRGEHLEGDAAAAELVASEVGDGERAAAEGRFDLVAIGENGSGWQQVGRWSHTRLARNSSIGPYSGSGRPLVSGAKGSAARPTRKTRHMVTPA